MINTVTKNYSSQQEEFCSYQVTYTNSNIVKSVPLDPDNKDYQEVQKWIAEGNTVIDNPPE